MDRARILATERFAPRAEEYDRAAAFPVEDYEDLRTSGFLALCVPEEHGGLGADFETYCLVAEQISSGQLLHRPDLQHACSHHVGDGSPDSGLIHARRGTREA